MCVCVLTLDRNPATSGLFPLSNDLQMLQRSFLALMLSYLEQRESRRKCVPVEPEPKGNKTKIYSYLKVNITSYEYGLAELQRFQYGNNNSNNIIVADTTRCKRRTRGILSCRLSYSSHLRPVYENCQRVPVSLALSNPLSFLFFCCLFFPIFHSV